MHNTTGEYVICHETSHILLKFINQIIYSVFTILNYIPCCLTGFFASTERNYNYSDWSQNSHYGVRDVD